MIRARLGLLAFVVRRAGARVLRVLPGAFVARIVPQARLDAPGASLDAVVARGLPGDPQTRLFIGPANSAGQAWMWARAISRVRPDVGAVSMMVVESDGGYGFPVDQGVSVAEYRWSRPWSRAQRDAVTTGFGHVLVESGRQLFGDASGSARSELRALRDAGVRVGLVFHGSDIRSPRRHAEANTWSPFRDRGWSVIPTLALRTRENARLVKRFPGAPVFVTTPDLFDELPDATWLPVVVDIGAWAAPRAALRGRRPVVAHAPNKVRLKGSELVDPVLRALDAEGVIEYRRVEGVPASEMPARFAEADIVLDQFRIGAYGVTAIEALAAGRLVIAHVLPSVRDRILRETGREVPILQADPDTLESVIRAVAADPAAYRHLVADAVSYATDVHDGTRSARVLLEKLIDP
jgi:hypothetical protein